MPCTTCLMVGLSVTKLMTPFIVASGVVVGNPAVLKTILVKAYYTLWASYLFAWELFTKELAAPVVISCRIPPPYSQRIWKDDQGGWGKKTRNPLLFFSKKRLVGEEEERKVIFKVTGYSFFIEGNTPLSVLYERLILLLFHQVFLWLWCWIPAQYVPASTGRT